MYPAIANAVAALDARVRPIENLRNIDASVEHVDRNGDRQIVIRPRALEVVDQLPRACNFAFPTFR